MRSFVLIFANLATAAALAACTQSSPTMVMAGSSAPSVAAAETRAAGQGGGRPGLPQTGLQQAESQPPVPDVTAPSYLVVEADSGRVLLAHGSLQRRAPASLTKVMTALLVLERGNLDDLITVDHAINALENTGSTVMGLEPGEQITVRDLLYGLMLPSGNDAAIALARYIAPNEAAFVALMNRRAMELGMKDTRFANAHGLDANNHYSTAYDLALLTRHAMTVPDFRALAATPVWTAEGRKHTYEMTNYNRLLGSYNGADGVKIGFTDAAAETLIGSVVREGRRLLVVVLGSNQRIADATMLLDRGFGAVAGS